ncbi:MAG: hypothetical protein GC150_01400 [Rhizobiales bacterium]|nr:hypothetical protein [Hyphomicrobiales bacterium]
MSLLGTISSAQHGMAFATLARRLGVREEGVAVATAVLLPELLECICAATATPKGTIAFLKRLSAESHSNHYESPSLMVDLRVRDLGMSILSELATARDFDQRVILEAATSSELRTSDVERMLPFITVLTVAAIALRADRPMRALLGDLVRNGEWARRQREPFGPLAAELARRSTASSSQTFGEGIFASLRARLEPRRSNEPGGPQPDSPVAAMSGETTQAARDAHRHADPRTRAMPPPGGADDHTSAPVPPRPPGLARLTERLAASHPPAAE